MRTQHARTARALAHSTRLRAPNNTSLLLCAGRAPCARGRARHDPERAGSNACTASTPLRRGSPFWKVAGQRWIRAGKPRGARYVSTLAFAPPCQRLCADSSAGMTLLFALLLPQLSMPASALPSGETCAGVHLSLVRDSNRRLRALNRADRIKRRAVVLAGDGSAAVGRQTSCWQRSQQAQERAARVIQREWRDHECRRKVCVPAWPQSACSWGPSYRNAVRRVVALRAKRF